MEWSTTRSLRAMLCAAVILCTGMPASADSAGDAGLQSLVDALGTGDFEQTGNAIRALAATGDARAAGILGRLADGGLYVVKADASVVAAEREADGFKVSNALTGAPLEPLPQAALERIKINNSLRRDLATAIGSLTLTSGNVAERSKAAESILKNRDASAIPRLELAIATEADGSVRALMVRAKATATLASNAQDDDKLSAIEVVSAYPDQDTRSLLESLAGDDGPVGTAARKARAVVEGKLAFWGNIQNLVYGLSLGSVLLLAAIGLAITFGVMGVINMAHGEMVMLGAYSTYVVQTVVRSHAPALTDYSLLFALPVAFIVSAAVGIALERGVIRWLYGRPLETLLATWGVSLILQQAVRTVFGASNREVGNPSWMSGSYELGLLTITWSRLWIILFALAVFAVLLVFMRRTFSGLQMRAVTQHRPMASAMGIRTPMVDALTFGLGSGIAGIAGVALSQIDNVSPNLGRGYIIDSFMVVVFGGVGSLWGTLIAALSLGVVNKLLEPFAGAVLGKILVLVFIVVFIQKRPRGLFALRGRSVES
jgi:urea transport system permease protein